MLSKLKRKYPDVTDSNDGDLGNCRFKSGNKKDRHAKIKAELDSFVKDTDDDTLTVPDFALDEETAEQQDTKNAQVRIKRYQKEREKELEAIKRVKTEGERYITDVALGYESPVDTPEESWEKSPSAVAAPPDDLFIFDERTGKTMLAREPDIRLMVDFNVFPADGTIIFGGIRRSGKTFGVRDLLYHLRHHFAGGLVFSATKHNGWWKEHIPDKYIYEELDGDVIDRFLKWRAASLVQQSRDFSKNAKDQQNYFIILDDMVDQMTRYFDVRLTGLLS